MCPRRPQHWSGLTPWRPAGRLLMRFQSRTGPLVHYKLRTFYFHLSSIHHCILLSMYFNIFQFEQHLLLLLCIVISYLNLSTYFFLYCSSFLSELYCILLRNISSALSISFSKVILEINVLSFLFVFTSENIFILSLLLTLYFH